jgi:membrane protease YdiL (CAAX protease family)
MVKSEKVLPLIKAVFALALLQLCRMTIESVFFLFAERTLLTDTIVSAVVMGILGFAVVLYAKAKGIPLSIFPSNKKLYILLTFAMLMLAVSTPFVTGDYSLLSICGLLYSVAVTPIFEELLFRGLIWNRLKEHYSKELSVYLITTLLFALWHLGYLDSVSYRMGLLGFTGLPFAMFMKAITGVCFGVLLGAVRYKTKNCFSTMLLHAVMNLFGR